MPRVTGLGHVGIYVDDLDAMAEFYSSFLGMTVSDRSDEEGIVFLSARPTEEHHELVLFKDAARRTEMQQVSFTVGSLDDLRTFYAQIKERAYPVDRVVSHGNAIGCYFRDPEGNQIEVYWPTGRVWPQPYLKDIDLELEEAELLALLP